MRIGRKKPYTVEEIAKKRCIRCGQRAEHQWSICALGNVWVPLCIACDIALNESVLTFMGLGSAEAMATYRDKWSSPGA